MNLTVICRFYRLYVLYGFLGSFGRLCRGSPFGAFFGLQLLP
jgi:hypothetical protein